jgi:Zn-dependent protease
MCDNITHITIPDTVTSIGFGTFQGCYALANVTVPGSITYIPMQAFAWCPSLTSVTIMDGVTTIGDWAFADCSALRSIEITRTVTNISGYAFYRCFNLTDMYFEGNAPSVGLNWTEGCLNLTVHYNANATGFTSPVWNGVAAYPISGAVTAPILDQLTPALEGAVVGAGAALVIAVVFSAPVEVSPVTGTKTSLKRKNRLLDFITGAIKADAQGLAGNVIDDLGLEKKNATEREAVIFGFSWPELFTALLASLVLGFSFMFTKGIDLGSVVNWLTYVLVAGVAAISSGLTQHHTAKKLGAVVEYKLWYLGSIILLLTTLLFGVAFSSPSKVAINEKEKMTVRQQAVVSASGPLTSFAVFLAFMALVPFGGTLASIGLLGASTNLLMAAYSMMPFIPMAGNKVYKWSKLAWAWMFVPMVVLYFAVTCLL